MGGAARAVLRRPAPGRYGLYSRCHQPQPTGPPLTIDTGPVLDAVLMAAAHPVPTNPVLLDNGDVVIDGGFAAPQPVLQALAAGAKSIVVLDTGRPEPHISAVPPARWYRVVLAAVRAQLDSKASLDVAAAAPERAHHCVVGRRTGLGPVGSVRRAPGRGPFGRCRPAWQTRRPLVEDQRRRCLYSGRRSALDRRGAPHSSLGSTELGRDASAVRGSLWRWSSASVTATARCDLGVPDALDDLVPHPRLVGSRRGLGCQGWLGVIDGVAGVPAGGDGVGGDGVGEARDVVCCCVEGHRE